MKSASAPNDPWEPLPKAGWDRAAAGHLLRRIGWTATPEAIDQALADGLTATVERAFPVKAQLLPEPKVISELRAASAQFGKDRRGATATQRRNLQREARERFRDALREISLLWLQNAHQPDRAAVEKWVLFLSDVYVIGAQKVRNTVLIHDHLALLQAHAFGSAPELTKAVSRSPAMINYLDLQASKREAPNENFARELFELFVLGEGNYTEQDIKEAARAFTGYRQRDNRFVFARRQHDAGSKTIFDHSGNFSGDDVIALAYRQEAAARFLPTELIRFYLTDQALPEGQIAALGQWWRHTDFDLRQLALRFFQSRPFFAAEFRARFIKSPVQFYLGLMQDLQLDVAPLQRFTLQPLQQMGPMLFNPPNVRGWIGGRSWINSATLAARRQLVQSLFEGIDERRLNADEQVELAAAQSRGSSHFSIESADLARQLPAHDPQTAARQLIDKFLPAAVSSEFYQVVVDALPPANSPDQQDRARLLIWETLLQTPAYQLC